MRLVGLTGGIATGKSSVSDLIRRTGIPVIDCDLIARQVVQPGRWGWSRVVKAFGSDILLKDGGLDRELLSRLIFEDARSRAKLNKATHLPIFVELGRQIFMAWLSHESVVVRPILHSRQTGADKWFYPTVLVWCDEETQIERLMKRDNCTEEVARTKIAAQMSLIEKSDKSTVLINNSASFASTTVEVNALALQLRRDQLPSYLVSPVALILQMLLLLCLFSYWR